MTSNTLSTTIQLLKKEIINKTRSSVVLISKEQVDLLKLDFLNEDFIEFKLLKVEFQIRRVKGKGKNYDYYLFRKLHSTETIKSLNLSNLNEKEILIEKKKYTLTSISQLKITEETQSIQPTTNINKEKSILNPNDDWKSGGKVLEETFKNLNKQIKAKDPNEKAPSKLYEEINLSINDQIKERYNSEILITQKVIEKKPLHTPLPEYRSNESPFEISSTTNLFDTVVDYSSLIKEKKYHNFWFLTDNSYQKVESVWEKLKDFYQISPKALDAVLKEVQHSQSLPVSQYAQALLNHSPQKLNFVQKIHNRIGELKNKNIQLEDYLTNLEQKLKLSSQRPEESDEYVYVLEQKAFVNKHIVESKLSLEKYNQKIEKFIDKHEGFNVSFYINVYGKNAIFSKYDEIIGEKLLSLNESINEIVFYHQEIERTIIFHLQKLHDAKKAKTKLQFLEQQEQASQLISNEKISEATIAKQKKAKLLEEMGQLAESEADVRQQILEEKRKLDQYLGALKSIEQIDNYEERLLKNKQEKESFQTKKEEFENYLSGLKLKIKVIEKNFNSFYSEISDLIKVFHEEMTSIYAENQKLLSFATQTLWNEWHEKGAKLINNIFEKKKSIVFEFADVVLLQIKNIYSHQKKIHTLAVKRQLEWEKIYEEIKNEFKILGYVRDIPKISEFNSKYVKELNINKLRLSDDVDKLINYQPNFHLINKNNHLFGLEPKLLDDENFLIIDQVWTKLTKEQEKYLKAKVFNENRDTNIENLNKELIKARKTIEASLIEQKYKFQKTNIFDFLPQESDNKDLEEKLSSFEKQLLYSWKEENYTSSNAIGQFKETVFNLAKKLFTVKSVHMENDQIHISETGKKLGKKQTEVFTEHDYFMKPKNIYDLSDSAPLVDLSVDDSEIFEVEDGEFLELIDNFDELSPEEQKAIVKPNKIPALEEWAHISIKKFREKRSKVEIDGVKDRLFALEKEIKQITEIHTTHQEKLNNSINQRNALFEEMQLDLSKIQQFLVAQEHELNLICDNLKNEMDEKIQLSITNSLEN